MRGNTTSAATAATKRRASRFHARVGVRLALAQAAPLVGPPVIALLLQQEPAAAARGLARWIFAPADAGRDLALVGASHQVEPFLATASAAITIRQGRVVGPVSLAADLAARFAVVGKLARGGTAAGPPAHRR